MSLIVDFPAADDLRRNVDQCKPSSPVKRLLKKHKKKSVQFSPMSEVVFFQQHDEYEAADNDVFYSKKDYKEMRLANKKAVEEARRVALQLESRPDDASHHPRPTDFDCLLAGIEHLITPGIIKKQIIGRRRCLSAVIQEQDRQWDEFGEVCNPEGIAQASMRHSLWSVNRARKIASYRAR